MSVQLVTILSDGFILQNRAITLDVQISVQNRKRKKQKKDGFFFLREGLLCPESESPKLRELRRPQQCKSMKGFYFQLELGLPPHPVQWSEARSPEPRFTAVFIESWQGLIDCRSFLVFTNWLIFIGCRVFLVFTNWLLAAGGCPLHPDKLKPGYGEYVDQTSPGIRGDDLTGQ